MFSDFDKAAKDYDSVFTFSEIGKAQRKRVYYYLFKNLGVGKLDILELNCGTGEDAYYLSSKGHQIIATDISEEMINTAVEKKNKTDVIFQQLDIKAITPNSFTRQFDLVFSNFGGLNCLSPQELSSLVKISEKLLKPKGKLAFVIMPKHSLWEKLYFLLRGKLKEANRRNRVDSAKVNVSGIPVSTWYYNPKEIVTLAKDAFKVSLIKPVGIAIPPSYLENYFSRNRWLFKRLVTLESWLSSSFWAKYADHYLIVLEKK